MQDAFGILKDSLSFVISCHRMNKCVNIDRSTGKVLLVEAVGVGLFFKKKIKMSRFGSTRLRNLARWSK